MKNIKVVIGSNFGDEGKGLMTDYFASKSDNGIVVRFNGGSQAGHTVVTPDNTRHVFSHFGSGTLAGLPTYLSKYFIVNPMVFKKEYEGLNKKGFSPKIFIENECLITTPYDIMINQIVETFRGNKNHGSCGLGINETIRRNEVISITFNDIFDKEEIIEKLLVIKNCYIIDRLRALGVDNIPLEYVNLLNNNNIIINYMKDIDFLINHSARIGESFLNSYNNIIFEGAQGLLLDQNSEFFPNVTPSNTGIQNVTEILKSKNLENENIEITYVTRSYMTRHGAGEFYTETEGKPYEGIVDLTNIPNQYQGTLRFGILDLDLLSKSIKKDLKFTKDLNYKANIAITCLDQIPETIRYKVNNLVYNSPDDTVIHFILSELGFNSAYLSYGNTRNTIINIEGEIND